MMSPMRHPGKGRSSHRWRNFPVCRYHQSYTISTRSGPHVCTRQCPAKWTRHSQVEESLKTRGVPQSLTKSCPLCSALNPCTGHVSPQFHVKFDDFFEMVQNKSTDLDAPDPEWKYLSGFAVRKGPTKGGAKGGLDGLLAPR